MLVVKVVVETGPLIASLLHLEVHSCSPLLEKAWRVPVAVPTYVLLFKSTAGGLAMVPVVGTLHIIDMVARSMATSWLRQLTNTTAPSGLVCAVSE